MPAGKEVPDLVKECGRSDGIFQVKRPYTIGSITDEQALALYVLSHSNNINISGEALSMCEASGGNLLDVLAYGEKLYKRSKRIEAAVKELSKYIDKLQNDVTKLEQRLVDQKNSI
ncbi:MAG: hypothetical protein SOV16_02075 [Anaerobiospirillum succiniciproducens]|uniref:hypothetical protein n=1 Tax=Anaerobiospirillum succiniciproducens TaxID=13335 RepID=UPI002A763A41|nr:hypothetical protein [Anaerobiospirillum succiniciproducens]MDY2797953.1 hypothetical protein [Anaerobiospirillum succiniciproducens]